MAIRKIISELKINRSSLRDLERSLGPSATKSIKKRVLEKKIRQLGKLGEQALKTTVPIDTQELRNEFITHQVDSDGMGVKIGISPGTHIGRDGKPRSAILLANILQHSTVFKRSRKSNAEGPYEISFSAGSPTARWIDAAIRGFKKERRNRGITNGR